MSGVFTRVAIRLIICGAVFVVAALGLWIRERDSLQLFAKRCLASRVLRGCPGATRGDTMGASPPSFIGSPSKDGRAWPTQEVGRRSGPGSRTGRSLANLMTESAPDRIFTVAEANRLIGAMEAVIAEIERLRGQLERHDRELQILDVLWGARVLDAENPDHGEFEKQRTGADETVGLIERLVRDEILARGVRFPTGGLEFGLLDFPTTLDGRVVYLCWKRGEPKVSHWHEISGGFAGRQPLTPEHATRMGTDYH